jgi:hypothetical protein
MNAGMARDGLIYPCPHRPVYHRHAHTLARRRAVPPRRRHGHHSHALLDDAARQVPGVIPQRLSAVAERMENRH